MRIEGLELMPYDGLTPCNDEGAISVVTQSMNFFRPYSSNWSANLRASMIGLGYGSRSITGCSSGLGVFAFKSRVILDLISNQILTIYVRNPLGRYMYLVSKDFDTPKCIERYKPFRSHWRRYAMEMIEDGVYIKKMSHEYLQNFRFRYNYCPTPEELENLKYSIVDLADRRDGDRNTRDRRMTMDNENELRTRRRRRRETRLTQDSDPF